ncbi:MAG: hypothetical protein AABX86_02905 [Nanoarchaeota archaeon]
METSESLSEKKIIVTTKDPRLHYYLRSEVMTGREAMRRYDYITEIDLAWIHDSTESQEYSITKYNGTYYDLKFYEWKSFSWNSLL